MPYSELHNYHKTVLVASYVEDIVLITYVVCGREIDLNVREVLPLCILGYVIPAFKSCLRVTMSFRTIELY
jgi:hypothetical protein